MNEGILQRYVFAKRWLGWSATPPVDQAMYYTIVSFGKEIEGLLDEQLKGVKP
ncbi:MAG: hypothetical protein OEY86_09360 [Nitrospira sp.]|nr:hypothetical protein [Nitrospira sp.]